MQENYVTLNELYKYMENRKIKVISAFNGKILCKRFNPKIHTETIGKRKIIKIWSEVEVIKRIYENIVSPIIVCYVDGEKEYQEKKEIIK